jgi:hypothetical protein
VRALRATGTKVVRSDVAVPFCQKVGALYTKRPVQKPLNAREINSERIFLAFFNILTGSPSGHVWDEDPLQPTKLKTTSTCHLPISFARNG